MAKLRGKGRKRDANLGSFKSKEARDDACDVPHEEVIPL